MSCSRYKKAIDLLRSVQNYFSPPHPLHDAIKEFLSTPNVNEHPYGGLSPLEILSLPFVQVALENKIVSEILAEAKGESRASVAQLLEDGGKATILLRKCFAFLNGDSGLHLEILLHLHNSEIYKEMRRQNESRSMLEV